MNEQVSLARYTTLGTGGPARWFDSPRPPTRSWSGSSGRGTTASLSPSSGSARTCSSRTKGSLGSSSSSRDPWPPPRPAKERSQLAEALPSPSASTAPEPPSWGGMEFVCAIPGTVGGAVWMNAGAYGGDTSGVLIRALVADADGASWMTPEELGLRYRASGLRYGQVVASAVFGLEPRPVAEIKATVADMQARRKAAQPTNKRTFGSVFKNPEHELTAGRMLEACGLRGFRIGGAQISPKHANFIENAGEARSADAIELIAEARRRAREQYGVTLHPEVQLLGALEVPPLDG